MPAVAAVATMDDFAVFDVAPGWLQLPVDMREGCAWWVLVQALAQRRGMGEFQAVSPLFDLDYSFYANLDDLRAAELRHECSRCRSKLDLTLDLFVGVEIGALALCQFRYRKLTDVSQVTDGHFN